MATWTATLERSSRSSEVKAPSRRLPKFKVPMTRLREIRGSTHRERMPSPWRITWGMGGGNRPRSSRLNTSGRRSSMARWLGPSGTVRDWFSCTRPRPVGKST